MEKFTSLKAYAAPLPRDNVDTDIIFPARYLTTVKRTGLGDMAFESLRLRQDGRPDPTCIFNQPPFDEAEILIAGRNFGCGSSREHAVWALQGMGFRCVIAKSFGDIFFSNCFTSGILAIRLPDEEVDKLIVGAHEGKLVIDLETQTLTGPGGKTISFEIDDFQRTCLLEGLDTIALALQDAEKIAAFEAGQRSAQPWLYATEESVK